jgi:hypothetical protein
VLRSLPGSPKDWKVDSKNFGQAEDARLAVYESLRAKGVPASPGGGWRLVLDSALRGVSSRCLVSLTAALLPGQLAQNDGSPDSKAKVAAGEKRKRDSAEGSEGGKVAGEPRMQSFTSSVGGELGGLIKKSLQKSRREVDRKTLAVQMRRS